MSAKTPAIQFCPTDYLGSQRVQMMTLEEEGAYCRLLWSCWQNGSIPSDPELAARLIGKGCSTTVARVVLPMFEIACGEGRVTHDRLERERAKQADWRKKSSAGGKKSAEMRQSLKGGSRVVQPPSSPIPPTLPAPLKRGPRRATPPLKCEAFRQFWTAYPKKKAIADAEKAWVKNGCAPKLPIILTALRTLKTSHDWMRNGGQFIPHPASWLNARGWEDELLPNIKIRPSV